MISANDVNIVVEDDLVFAKDMLLDLCHEHSLSYPTYHEYPHYPATTDVVTHYIGVICVANNSFTSKATVSRQKAFREACHDAYTELQTMLRKGMEMLCVMQ